MKLIFLMLYVFSFYLNLYSQQDTFIVYNSFLNQLDILASPEYDSTISFDNTDWFLGSLPGSINLPQSPPQVTPPGSGFSELSRVDSIFQILDYPIRTAIKLFGFLNDSLVTQCSGILIEKNIVLTSAHCVCYRFESNQHRVFLDSAVIIPAYNDGEVHPQIGKSTGSIFYVPLDWYNQAQYNDIALIRLNDDIGLKTGWLGISFNNDLQFFDEKLFYKFSYPVGYDLSDSTRYFDPDFMYFNYGYLDLFENSYLGFNLNGVRGQSGSSLINSHNNSMVTYGTLSWASNSRHFRITNKNFHILKEIISGITSVNGDNYDFFEDKFSLEQNYPNPFNTSTMIKYSIPFESYVTIKVYNLLGKEISTLFEGNKTAGNYQVQFDAKILSSGVYFYKISSGKINYLKKMTLIK